MEIKAGNKQALSRLIEARTGIKIDSVMLFDIQAKRIHEYKRENLKVLHILSLYLRLKKGEVTHMSPCTFIFAWKAAPGYYMAKLIFRLILAVAELINQDADVHDQVFLPGFNFKNVQHLYPAADLSEQISLAGMEASGTGNMKFFLKGALTVGTLDGGNVKIKEK